MSSKFTFKHILCLLNDMSFIFFFVMMHCNFACVLAYFCWHCVSHRLDVNECIEKGACPGHCENNIGSYTCTSKHKLGYEEDTCPPGYQWEAATGFCTGLNLFNFLLV